MNLGGVVSDIRANLSAYRQDTRGASDDNDREDYERVGNIAEALASELESGNIEQAKRSALAFSRSVSDSFATQPRSFRPLADAVERSRRLLGI